MQFVDLKEQYRRYREDIDRNIKEVIENTAFIRGPFGKKLEKDLSEYCGADFAVGCASGTDALLVPLMAYDVQPGDEIITTPFTFIATVEVISFIGAVPVFADIEEETGLIDVSQIEDKITEKTRGIIPVSLYGQVADIDEINQIAKKNELFVIEDAAQSFGSVYKGRKSCNLSDVGATSFFPSKPLGCYGDGGMVFTSNEVLADRMRRLVNHGQKERYRHSEIGLNLRLDEIQAAVVEAKFKYFDDECRMRQKAGDFYTELLKDCRNIKTPVTKESTDRHVFAQYSVRSSKRDTVISHLKENKIPTAVHYPMPVHLQEAYQYLGYRKGDFQVSEKVSSEIFSLPMHPFLSEDDQKFIARQVINAAE